MTLIISISPLNKGENSGKRQGIWIVFDLDVVIDALRK
jgi:hypothetical protein